MPAVNSLASAVGRRAGRRTAKRSSQVAGERCHMLTRSRAEWPRFCVQPWLGAFSLRAGSRAEERGSRHRLIFLTCTCLNPTLQEAREQPLIERPRWSFFHFPPDFLNELLSVSRPLSQLWTLPSAFTWGGGGEDSCVDNSWGSQCVDVKTDPVVNLITEGGFCFWTSWRCVKCTEAERCQE